VTPCLLIINVNQSVFITRNDDNWHLKMPVVIIAGDKDRLVNIDKQSARLHRDVSQSSFHRIPATGHMIHQTAPRVAMAAINEVSK